VAPHAFVFYNKFASGAKCPRCPRLTVPNFLAELFPDKSVRVVRNWPVRIFLTGHKKSSLISQTVFL